MRKLFICLANSKKYGERCVAGVEITQKENGKFRLLLEEQKPKWVRPVTRSEHGSIPEDWVKEMQLMDVYEVQAYQPCPEGYQKENFFFAANSFKKILRIEKRKAVLEKIMETASPCLFYNRGKAISHEKIKEVDCSLVLIKAEQAEVYGKKHRVWQLPQMRIKFLYHQDQYDLPITDIAFLECYQATPSIIEEAEVVYITVSLSINVDGWHYKLAAGIITI